MHFDADSKDHSQQVLKSIQVVQQQVERQLKAQRLPKADLTPFDGNPMNYFLFIKCFENNVEKCTDDQSERLQLLMQYCTGKAKDIVKGCGMLDADKGYETARKLLEKRFGDKYLVTNAWISRVADGSVIGPNDREALQDLADDLENCEIVLNVAGRLNEINSDDKLIKILQRVPNYLRSRWQSKAREIRDQGKVPTIVHVKDLIANAAREKNDPVFGGILDRIHRDYKKPTKTPNTSTSQSYTFSTQTNDIQGPRTSSEAIHSFSSWKCFYCQANHKLSECKDFEKIPSKDKLDYIRKRKLCENCLSSTHYAGGCKVPNGCKVQDCTFTRKHLGVLHSALLTHRREKNRNTRKP
ncbi:hypothetical protein QZH41_003066 [Actinostola sp. cb2023]|nr:hypothetical protein QZH41_003066 [Actinostola sp. cb2023]